MAPLLLLLFWGHLHLALSCSAIFSTSVWEGKVWCHKCREGMWGSESVQLIWRDNLSCALNVNFYWLSAFAPSTQEGRSGHAPTWPPFLLTGFQHQPNLHSLPLRVPRLVIEQYFMHFWPIFLNLVFQSLFCPALFLLSAEEDTLKLIMGLVW